MPGQESNYLSIENWYNTISPWGFRKDLAHIIHIGRPFYIGFGEVNVENPCGVRLISRIMLLFMDNRGMFNDNDTGENSNYYLYINKWFNSLSPFYLIDKGISMICVYNGGYLSSMYTNYNSGGVRYSIFTI